MHPYHQARVQLCHLAFQQYLIEFDPYRKANRLREWSDHCSKLGLSIPEFLSAAGVGLDAQATESILGRIRKPKSGTSRSSASSNTHGMSESIPTLPIPKALEEAEKGFVCQHCGAAFASHKQLNGHQKAHRKQK